MWPSEKVVAAAFGHRAAEVIPNPDGGLARGIRSADPAVYVILTTPGKGFACCGHCGQREEAPPPPSSRGLNGAPEPLFSPGTRAYALHMLTWMHAWAKTHSHDAPEVPEVTPAAPES